MGLSREAVKQDMVVELPLNTPFENMAVAQSSYPEQSNFSIVIQRCFIGKTDTCGTLEFEEYCVQIERALQSILKGRKSSGTYRVSMSFKALESEKSVPAKLFHNLDFEVPPDRHDSLP